MMIEQQAYHKSSSAIRAPLQELLSKTFNVLDILSYPLFTIGPTVVGPEEKLQNKGSKMA